MIERSGLYYPLVGILPGKIQEKLGQKLKRSALNYTRANSLTEMAAAGVSIYYSATMTEGIISIGLISGAGFLMISDISRFWVTIDYKDIKGCPSSSIILGLPIEMLKGTYSIVKGIFKGIAKSYKDASEEYNAGPIALPEPKKKE